MSTSEEILADIIAEEFAKPFVDPRFREVFGAAADIARRFAAAEVAREREKVPRRVVAAFVAPQDSTSWLADVPGLAHEPKES